jgi:predicted Holliday junction resolvase-like endonuclease
MKPPQFIVTVIMSLVSLILVINLIFMGQKNQSLQTQLQTQQEEINKGSMSQQIGVNLLKEIAQASVKDEKLKDVLTKSGYTVTVNASPSPGAASTTTPAPAATP